MAKKLRKGLNEDTHFIKRGKFEMVTAKTYLIIALVVFHIIPLIFAFKGEAGIQALFHMFLQIINGMVVAILCVFYGIRVGYNFKFPLIMSVLSILSYVIYYSGSSIFADAGHFVMTGFAYGFTYTVFAFAFTAVGGWMKRFF